MELIVLSNILYSLRLTEESKKIFKISQVMDGTSTETFVGLDFYEDATANDIGAVENTSEEIFVENEIKKSIWNKMPLDSSHPMVLKLRKQLEKIWEIVIHPNTTLSSIDLKRASRVFKMYDNKFSKERYRPWQTANKEIAITPRQALEIISNVVQEIFFDTPDEFKTKEYMGEFRDWAHGVFQDYADYYYENIDSSERDLFLNEVTKQVDEHPDLSEEDVDNLKEFYNEQERKLRQQEEAWNSTIQMDEGIL